MSKYILSIDQGTTSTRSMIFDSDFKIISADQMEFKQYFPKDGCVTRSFGNYEYYSPNC